MTTADPPAPLQAGISRRHGCDFVPCCSGVVSGDSSLGAPGFTEQLEGERRWRRWWCWWCRFWAVVSTVTLSMRSSEITSKPPRPSCPPCNAYRAQASGKKQVFPIRLDNRLLAGRRGASPWLWRARRTTQHNTAEYATRSNSIQFPHVRLGCRGRRYIIAQRAADLEGTAEG